MARYYPVASHTPTPTTVSENAVVDQILPKGPWVHVMGVKTVAFGSFVSTCLPVPKGAIKGKVRVGHRPAHHNTNTLPPYTFIIAAL